MPQRTTYERRPRRDTAPVRLGLVPAASAGSDADQDGPTGAAPFTLVRYISRRTPE
jgi:hypothetical protein